MFCNILFNKGNPRTVVDAPSNYRRCREILLLKWRLISCIR